MIKEYFPDGTVIEDWFYDTSVPALDELGARYELLKYGILNDGKVHTKEIQALIDKAYENGGGVIVVSGGTFVSGALNFRQGVNLYIEKGATLMGSDDISDYPVCETRIEGENCMYYPALVNADGVDGFVMCGEGTVDGNGFKSWKAFWQRRAWNPQCTNKDEQRPRLVYISNSRNVIVADLNLQNSHFWTNHIYKCDRVKFINCRITSPAEPVKAPSTDAIDIDVCNDVLVKNCYMAVNDDAVALKGGRGPWADTLSENGMNERVIIEDCEYGFCHSCLTCGSESVHNRNIIMRRVNVNDAVRLLTLKMRPDTPQHYQYITIDDIRAKVWAFIDINPWTQFYDLKDRKDRPLSFADHVAMKNCECECEKYFNVERADDQYRLTDFTFENLKIKAKDTSFDENAIENVIVNNVNLEN